MEGREGFQLLSELVRFTRCITQLIKMQSVTQNTLSTQERPDPGSSLCAQLEGCPRNGMGRSMWREGGPVGVPLVKPQPES